jgi:AcrR family transcriptional regulator
MPTKTTDLTTELKIKEAARMLFMQKGYANTRTRDIAAEAGINLALLNYYYRSKEKLFEIIMLEKLQAFFKQIKTFLNDDISMEEKVQRFVNDYIDMLLEQPDLPLFVLSEMRNHPGTFLRKSGIPKIVKELNFEKKIQAYKGNQKPKYNPHQLLVSLASMTIFPFVGKPVVKAITGSDDIQFKAMMEERKKLIPLWFHQMLTTI